MLAVNPKREELYKQAGRQIISLIEKDIKPLDIINAKSMDNALALDMAMGGSTNTVLHTLAIASEAGIKYDLERINKISAKCPNICKVSPSSAFHVEDVDAAGGISAILKEISKVPKLLNLDTLTVTGKKLGENIADAKINNTAVIHSLENAYSKTGGLAILKGNLAPNGAVIKIGGRRGKYAHPHRPGLIFDSQEDACDGILAGKVKAGDVVIIRYEGPKGGPGMQEMLSPTSYIMGAGLGESVALITDGQVQRRHTRRLYRPRQPRSGGRRTNRTIEKRRHNRNRHTSQQDKREAVGQGTSRPQEKMEAEKTENHNRLPCQIRLYGHKRRHRCGAEMVN